MKKQLIDMKTLLIIGSCLLLAACTGRTSQSGTEEKPVITVTLEPQRYFTEAIAGDKFTVVSMVPKGSSPETYDPVPQQLVSLGDSKAYFRIGYIGFDGPSDEQCPSYPSVRHLQRNRPDSERQRTWQRIS